MGGPAHRIQSARGFLRLPTPSRPFDLILLTLAALGSNKVLNGLWDIALSTVGGDDDLGGNRLTRTFCLVSLRH